jgi:DNA-binding CsgD family transcriptional regulator
LTQSNELSKRESEVLKLLLEGKSNKLMASSLDISERTVEFHLKNIFAKYQVNSRVELILKLGESTVAGKPVESTVAGKEEIPENSDRPNQWKWPASLREALSNIGKEFRMEGTLNSNARSSTNPMTFFESIRVCFIKYAEFNGRASRLEFWWFALFITLLASALAYISQNLSEVFLIAVLLPLLAAGSRRLHDTGRSAWWELFLLAPVGGIILLGSLWAVPSKNPLPEDTPPA